jgi:hypothetical protein
MRFLTSGLWFAAAALAGSTGCTQSEHRAQMESSTYTVRRASEPLTLEATTSHADGQDPSRAKARPAQMEPEWDSPVWATAATLELKHFMGQRPAHFPRTQARLLYDHQFLYVIFRVEDRYVRAVAREHQGPVWRDSCVEFFFTPGTDTTRGYFNLEMNCGGTMLLRLQDAPVTNGRWVTPEDLARIQVISTLPKLIEPEITEPVVWSVAYRLPLDLLSKYCPWAERPAPGVRWRANFYKCGDDTSHPHWLTWAPVRHSKPNFHLPACFGELVFE